MAHPDYQNQYFASRKGYSARSGKIDANGSLELDFPSILCNL